MLKSVSYAQSADENRYVLNSVYFNLTKEKLTLIATDGRRLALMGKPITVSDESVSNLIVPAKTITELERLLGQGKDVKITFTERQVAFDIQLNEESTQTIGLVQSTYLVSKVVEGNYPNYKQVIPKESDHRIKIERELLLACIQGAALVTNDKNNSIKIKIGQNLVEITSSSPEYGESKELVVIAYEGPEVQVSFNPQYLIAPLRALTKDEIFFEFKDELSPGVFKTNDDFMCVVMPLRLN